VTTPGECSEQADGSTKIQKQLHSTSTGSSNDSMLCDFKAQHDYKASSGDFRWVCTAISVGWKRDFRVRRMGTILGFGYTTNGCRDFKKEGAWCRDFKKEGLRVSVTRVQG
jgi:hypothetical protein